MGVAEQFRHPIIFCNNIVNYLDKTPAMFFGILQRGMAEKSVF